MDRKDHSRFTVRNHSQPTTVNKPEHTTPLPETAATLADKPVVAEDPEKLRCVLLKMFIDQDGDTPKVFTEKEKQQVRELAKKHGSEKFLAAGRAWVKDQPWNNATTNPFRGFIDKFESYLLKLDYDKQIEKGRLTPEQIKRAGEESLRLRNALFRGPEDRHGPDDF